MPLKSCLFALTLSMAEAIDRASFSRSAFDPRTRPLFTRVTTITRLVADTSTLPLSYWVAARIAFLISGSAARNWPASGGTWSRIGVTVCAFAATAPPKNSESTIAVLRLFNAASVGIVLVLVMLGVPSRVKPPRSDWLGEMGNRPAMSGRCPVGAELLRCTALLSQDGAVRRISFKRGQRRRYRQESRS